MSDFEGCREITDAERIGDAIERSTEKSDQDRWWEAYNTALNGIIANPARMEYHDPMDVSGPVEYARELANSALIEFNKRWSNP